MEGKLIKVENDYRLVNKIIIGTTDLEYQQAFSDVCNKLSIKNCQAIENGYDLDELVKERFGETFWHDGDKHFKEGFQKALEILGDKKFSELDKKIDSMVDFAKNHFTTEAYDTIQMFAVNLKANIQKIQQQTEWDVSFNPEEKDSEGCLILKRL